MYVQGELLQSPAQVLVNTVNTVGVMGKGIAREFKRLFPDMFTQYRDMCESGQFRVGMLWLYKTPNKWVLNFPTKKDWRDPSRIEYIDLGLRKFVQTYAQQRIHSVAFPPLGCGNGQLDFESQVKPLMEKYLRNLPIDVFIYPDRGTIFVEHMDPADMRVWLRTEPTALPFSEVWEDLVDLIKKRRQFDTIAKKGQFSATVSDDPAGIIIDSSAQRYLIRYETLRSFWQQLRGHGFTSRYMAPGVDRQVSYLIAIFAELDYVAPVRMAEHYDHYRNSRMVGIQVLPNVYAHRSMSPRESTQLSLFDTGS